MVFAVQAFLAFRNASRRDTISSTIQTRLAQAGVHDVSRVDGTSMAGDPEVCLTVRFNTLPEADSFWADVQAAVGTGVNGPVTGSFVSRHNCPHDTSTTPCLESDRRTF